MASLYIHIPFCKQKCIYCDFMSGTNHSLMPVYVDALVEEMRRYVHFFDSDPIETIYLGGGTPSLLPVALIGKIFDSIKTIWNIENVSEVTLECNPENINEDFLENIRLLPVNRLSLGVQSFVDDELKWLGRCHDAETAKKAVRMARNAGFENISCDLIFALPVQTIDSLRFSLDELVSLDLQHVSVYSLMFEEGSKISMLLKKGDLAPLDEDTSATMYGVVTDVLKKNGFSHYEISNYAKPGFRSKHNMGYWKGVRYLGIGASAHSFSGDSRFFNIPNTLKYCNAVNSSTEFSTIENISDKEKFNEYVFTALRTSDGLNLNELRSRFGEDKYDYVVSVALKYVRSDDMVISSTPKIASPSNTLSSSNTLSLSKIADAGFPSIAEANSLKGFSLSFLQGNPGRGSIYNLRLTEKGVYISDYIISDFMLVD